MPPEPNDKMDELLKAYADRRRKKAGAFEMHPATRQMLQAEVARQHAREGSSTRAEIGKWHFLNPARMFLYSTGLAAAVICVALVVREQRPVSTEPKPATALAYLKPKNTVSPPAALALATSTPADLLTLTAKTLASDKQQDLLMAGQPGQGHQSDQSDRRKFGYGDIVKAGSGMDPRTTNYIKNKLNHIIIPKIEFRDATVREALAFLQQKSREVDNTETDPARKGVNIVLKADVFPNLSEARADAKKTYIQGDLGYTIPSEARITLSLTNIPLSEALRYITNLAGLKEKIDPYVVAIVPLSYGSPTLITKEWVAPAVFLASNDVASGSDALSSQNIQKAIDASTASGGKSPIALHTTAQELLIDNGIPFPPGASAKYDSSNNKLVVRNTDDNLDLVEQYLGSLNSTAGTHPKAEPLETGGTALQNQSGMLADAGSTKKDTNSIERAEPLPPAAAPATPIPAMDAAPAPADMAAASQPAPEGASQAGKGQDLDQSKALKPTASPSSILALFEIRLNGDQIRLIDADGSTYVGTIDLPKSQQQQAALSKGRMFANHAAITQQSYAQVQQQTRVQTPSGVLAGISNSMPVAADRPAQQKSEEATPGEQGYAFRASGDCHSLGRFVTVEGTYYAAAPQDQLQDLAQAKKQITKDAQGTAGGASTAGRIQAQAQIGNNMRIDINATSIPLKARSN
ncbi:MAG: hypothetical protein WCD79_20325 [Chthoniobacteraceae bacterium]